MVITDTSFSKMYADLGAISEQYYDIIIPQRDGYQLDPAEGGYWMWPHQWFWELYMHSKAGDVLGLALENAIGRGNKEDPTRSFSVKLWIGEQGTLVRIRDDGCGFPHKAYTALMRQGDYRYRQGYGRGLREYDQSHAHVAFEGDGSILNIFTPRYAV